MPRGDLFPDIAPFETGLLPLGDGHVMYWEQVGNPRGQPVLFLHGFSGSGLSWAGLTGLGSRFRVIVPDLPGHGRDRRGAGQAGSF